MHLLLDALDSLANIYLYARVQFFFRDLLPCMPASKDDDLQPTSEEASLQDPITLKRITTPAKGISCMHRACFDLSIYLDFCNQQNEWRCSICMAPCMFADLRVDSLYQQILQDPSLGLDEDIDTVVITLGDHDKPWVFKGGALARRARAGHVF